MMPIIIDASLSEPPSSVTCFRDLTLYTNCFIKKNVVIECERNMRDIYWRWLKKYGAFDFVADIVDPFTERDISIRPKRASITVTRIDSSTLHAILDQLERLRRREQRNYFE